MILGQLIQLKLPLSPFLISDLLCYDLYFDAESLLILSCYFVMFDI
jgi:hypothetical protein